MCASTREQLVAIFQPPRNVQVASNDVTCAQPRIYRSERVILTEKKNTKLNRDRNNRSPARRQHDEMYPVKYSSPINVSKERRIEEENEEEEDEGEYENQRNESVSRVTRF